MIRDHTNHTKPNKKAPQGFFVHLYEVLRDLQELANLVFVETNDHVITDANDRHPHLSRHINHLLACLKVRGNVDIFILYAMLIKKLLSGMTEVAGRRAVNRYLCIHMQIELYVMLGEYITKHISPKLEARKE